MLLKSGQGLLAIINDILDFSKIEAGKLTLETVPVDPASIVDDVVKLFAERAASKGLDLAGYVERDVPALIAADPVRCHQILSNLVNNALKFTERGGIFVHLANAGRDGAGRSLLQYSVTDTGIGIPAEKVATIFEAFSQADQSTTRHYGGTGIGLTICQRLTAAMGGDIEVTSEVGRGSTFVVSIPMATIEDRILPPPRGPAQRIIIALPEGPTCAALIRYAQDHNFNAVRIAPDLLDQTHLTGVAAVFADIAVLRTFSRTRAGSSAPRLEEPVVVACTHFGETRTGVGPGGRNPDIVMETPVSARDIHVCFERIGNGTAYHEAVHSESAAASETPAAVALPDFSGLRVLAADDSAVNRELLMEALSRFGIECTCVTDGDAALRAMQTRDFDIVFMDGSMPIMDGFEASRAMRSWESKNGRGQIPIIALTAHVIGEHADHWRASGMTECITKPFSLKALQACLEKHAPHRPGHDIDRTSNVPLPSMTAATALMDSDAEWAASELLEPDVIYSIRQMQQPGDNLVGRMIGLYATHAPLALEKIIEVAGTDDCRQLAQAAHALKSLSLSVGAKRNAALCAALELDASRGCGERKVEYLIALRTAMSSTIAELRKFEADRCAPPQSESVIAADESVRKSS